jgi:hypothetical protein
MSKIPGTNAGLSDGAAIEAGTILRQGWDILRSLQFNKTASILRYTVTDTQIEQDRKASLGIGAAKTLATGLADLDVYVTPVSEKIVMASGGKILLGDFLFVFWVEVKETDKLSYAGRSYEVVQIRAYDPDVGQCQIIGRVI